MEQLVIGVFDNYGDAEQVRVELVGVGLAQRDIQISAATEATSVGTTSGASGAAGATRMESGASSSSMTATRRSGDDESFGEKIADFFRSIFGTGEGTSDSTRYAEMYPEAIRRGSAVVTVTARDDSQVSLAQAVMERNGAIDIDERSASWSSASAAAPATPASSTTGSAQQARTSIPVVEEELAVGKREITRGKVRIVSVVTETPVEETLRLREQHAVIERTPADRPASEAELSGWREGSVEIQETTEEPVVSKTARVVEEVVVGTDTSEHTETVRDTVRRKDVKIEKGTQEPSAPGQSPGSNPGSTKR